MASAAIDVHRLDTLPGLCAKTGVRTESTRRQEFIDIPGWTLLLILWGFLPFLIAALFSRRKVTVSLPISGTSLHRLQVIDRAVMGCLLLAIGILITALFTSESAWAWAGIGIAVLTLLGGAVARRITWVSGRLDGDVLWVYGVHPSFADRVELMAPQHISKKTSSGRSAIVPLMVTALVLVLLLFMALRLRT